MRSPLDALTLPSADEWWDVTPVYVGPDFRFPRTPDFGDPKRMYVRSPMTTAGIASLLQHYRHILLTRHEADRSRPMTAREILRLSKEHFAAGTATWFTSLDGTVVMIWHSVELPSAVSKGVLTGAGTVRLWGKIARMMSPTLWELIALAHRNAHVSHRTIGTSVDAAAREYICRNHELAAHTRTIHNYEACAPGMLDASRLPDFLTRDRAQYRQCCITAAQRGEGWLHYYSIDHVSALYYAPVWKVRALVRRIRAEQALQALGASSNL